MLIDWFTVIAQIVNFLILMALMKWLLFDRIIKAVDQREASIRERLEQARQQREQAESKNEELAQRESHIKREREQVLAKARSDAEERRSELEKRARREVDQRKAQWMAALETEQEHFLSSFVELASGGAFELARKALDELADAELNELAARAFVGRLNNLSDDEIADFAQGLEESGGEATASCGLEFPDDARQSVEKALAGVLAREVRVNWALSRQAGFGLSLKAGGRVLSWTLSAYLEELRGKAQKAIKAQLEERPENGQAEQSAS